MRAYLIFQDGSIFSGESIGKRGEVIGEAVFTTAMTGFVETLTDPSYYGQIITQTFPMIGNYGAMHSDAESDKVFASGYIVRELCSLGSNFRKDMDFNDYLKKHGVVGIAGIDTRAITKKIRDYGKINAMISDSKNNLEQKFAALNAYKIRDAVKNISAKEVSISGSGSRRVVLWDFGAKENIFRELLSLGYTVIRVPYDYTAEQILQLCPSGVVLSNGGGDPAENKKIIAEIKKLMDIKIPMFGICLGHQLLCLAAGAKTKRLKFGHRGTNQPVKDLVDGRIYITSQNHGYSVRSLPSDEVRVRFVNANDKTCEGVDFINLPIFSVQFHPEGCGGPHDTKFLFRRFATLLEEVNFNA